jgi:hypothetical protein
MQTVRFGATKVCHPSFTTAAQLSLSEELGILFIQKPTLSDGALAVSRYRR